MVDRRKLVSVLVLDESPTRLDRNQFKAADLQPDVPSIQSFFKDLIAEGGGSFP